MSPARRMRGRTPAAWARLVSSAAAALLLPGAAGALPAGGIFAAASATAGLAVPNAAAAGTQAQRSWVVESFEADILVLQSGEVVVEETIRPRFQGSFNGIVRLIPIRYETPGARFAYDLRLRVERVTDGRGADLRHELGRERHYRTIKIWIPGATDAARTVMIRYRVERALRFHDEYDELYWNVTGDEWPVPIERSAAVVHLPAGVTGVRATAFTGPFGATEGNAEVRVDDRRVEVRTRGALGMWEGLTVGVAWDPGPVRRPTTIERARDFLVANSPLGIPPLVLLLMLRHWWRRGRDPEVGSVEPRYEPPDGLTAGEVGVVIDDRPDLKDVTATLVELAIHGHLTIEEVEEKKFLGLFAEREYVFHRRTGRDAWTELLPHERALLDALFSSGGRSTVRLSDLQNEFYRDLPRIRDKLFDSLLRHEVYETRPDKVKARYAVLGVVAGLALLAGLAFSEALGLAPAAVAVAALLTAGVVVGFGRFMPVRTESGARTLRKVRGFEEFLRRVESDRFRRMITGPEMFERYLPYAMALGVESQWAAAFEGMYREPPQWYRGGDPLHFRPTAFAADLGRMSTMTASAMASRPRSSGGSAFGGGGSGGGFSGGGFGGGGGRAF